MTTFLNNSGYKVKAGAVPSLAGLRPEAGAMVYAEDLAWLFFSDGINWYRASEVGDRIQLTGTNIVNAFTAATPVTPAEMVDTETLNRGTSFTFSLVGQSLTVNNAGTYNGVSNITYSADTNNVELFQEVLVGGTTVVDSALRVLQNQDERYSIQGPLLLPGLVGGEVFTYRLTCSKTCNLTIVTSLIDVAKVS